MNYNKGAEIPRVCVKPTPGRLKLNVVLLLKAETQNEAPTRENENGTGSNFLNAQKVGVGNY